MYTQHADFEAVNEKLDTCQQDPNITHTEVKILPNNIERTYMAFMVGS